MKYLYQGEEVTHVRDVEQEGSANESEQVVIALEDGTEKTVKRDELRQK